MMPIMDLSRLHITHPNKHLLYIALMIKPPLIRCVLIIGKWVESTVEVYQSKRVSKCIASEEEQDGGKKISLVSDLASFVLLLKVSWE